MTLVPRKHNVLSNKTQVTMDVENNTALALVGVIYSLSGMHSGISLTRLW